MVIMLTLLIDSSQTESLGTNSKKVWVSQPVFRGTEVVRGAKFSVPRKDKKNKKHTSSN